MDKKWTGFLFPFLRLWADFFSFTCLPSSWFSVSHGAALSLHIPAVVAVHVFLSVRALPSPPESWELMPTLWQCRDGGSGLSRIDVSWRRFVVAHPYTPGTIKLKIIGSESPPFIDPLESVNSPRHKRQCIQRNVHTLSHMYMRAHTQTGKVERAVS